MSVNYQSVTLNPGESFSVNTPGKCFVCDTATGDFELRAGDQAPITFSAKRTFGSSTSPVVQRWAIKDLTGSPNTIVFGVSMADVKIETSIGTFAATVTTSGRDASTYSKGASATILSGTNITATGLDGSKIRREIRIKNRSTSVGTLEVGDLAGNLMCEPLAPGAAEWALIGNAQLKLSAVGGDVNYIVGQTFYS